MRENIVKISQNKREKTAPILVVLGGVKREERDKITFQSDCWEKNEILQSTQPLVGEGICKLLWHCEFIIYWGTSRWAQEECEIEEQIKGKRLFIFQRNPLSFEYD